MDTLKETPLYQKHIQMGARMVPFGGWSMPVQYTGIIDEHMHTRSRAGLFDICHMGEFVIAGTGAEKDLENLVTCRVLDMPEGKCRYGFLLNEKGGIVDDLIVFKLKKDEFMLVVNASTREKDASWVRGNISSASSFSDISDKTAKLDVQGPASGSVVSSLFGAARVEGLKRYYFACADLEGARVILSRTGYTGELGYELFFSAERALKFWDRLLAFGDVKPVGLGARDTLRLEMGYSLYGSDIDETHTPVEANLEKFVFMDKDFIGRGALLKQKKEGPRQILKGFLCEGRRSARRGFEVILENKTVGRATSAGFSPCLKKGIGLCYINTEYSADGREVALTDGKTEIKAVIKNIPLYRPE